MYELDVGPLSDEGPIGSMKVNIDSCHRLANLGNGGCHCDVLSRGHWAHVVCGDMQRDACVVQLGPQCGAAHDIHQRGCT